VVGAEARCVDHPIAAPAPGVAITAGDPHDPPISALGVDVVLECTGRFRDKAGGEKHRTAGAKRVIISAPGEKDIDGTFCVGINHQSYDPSKHNIVSNASCTTNCLAPIAKVVNDTFGIV